MKQFKDLFDKFINKTAFDFTFLKIIPVKKVITVFSVISILIMLMFAALKIVPSLFSDNSDFSESFKNDDDSLTIDIDMTDYLIPEDITSLKNFSWVPYRGVKEKWSQEDVDEFWINPETTVRETASEKNRQHIEDLFESVP